MKQQKTQDSHTIKELLEASQSLTSNSTTEPQYWKQPDIGIKTEMKTKEIEPKSLDITPHANQHQIFDKETRNVKWKKKSCLTSLHFCRHWADLKLPCSGLPILHTCLSAHSWSQVTRQGQDMLPWSAVWLGLPVVLGIRQCLSLIICSAWAQPILSKFNSP